MVPKLRLMFYLSVTLLLCTGIAWPVQAQGIPPATVPPQNVSAVLPQVNILVDQDCIALSNEPSGNLISKLVAAGYRDYNLYDLLIALQADTDPAISMILTDDFLKVLAADPANSPIFTTQLLTVDIPGNTVEICSEGTYWTVPISGYSVSAKGFPTLIANVSGVEYANFTHTTGTSGDIATWDMADYPLVGMTTTYHVFAVGWGVGQPPLQYLPLIVR